jgi:hypothetical protein
MDYSYSPQDVLRMLLDQAISHRKIKNMLLSAAKLSNQIIIKPGSDNTSIPAFAPKPGMRLSNPIPQILATAAELSKQIITKPGSNNTSKPGMGLSNPIPQILASAAGLSNQIIKPGSNNASMLAFAPKPGMGLDNPIPQILANAAKLSNQIIIKPGSDNASILSRILPSRYGVATNAEQKISTDMIRQILSNAASLTNKIKTVVPKPIVIPQKFTVDLIKNILTNSAKLTSELINRSAYAKLPILAKQQLPYTNTRYGPADDKSEIENKNEPQVSIGDKFKSAILDQLKAFQSDEREDQYEINYSADRVKNPSTAEDTVNYSSSEGSFVYTDDGKRQKNGAIDASFDWKTLPASSPPPAPAPAPAPAASVVQPQAPAPAPAPAPAASVVQPPAPAPAPAPVTDDSNTITEILKASSQLINLITEEHDVIQDILKNSSQLVQQITSEPI